MENINWYPGHMKKTKELIQNNMKMIDLVIEVVDARIPVSSRNPMIDKLTGSKPRLIVLNKSDLSDDRQNRKWIESFEKGDVRALAMNSMSGAGVKQLFKLLGAMKAERQETQNALKKKKPMRMMIVGVPNVGKSSLINRMTGKKSTQTGDRPGVTKGKQWLTLKNGMQLLDTPGILWPKFEDRKTGLNLAFCGSIRDEILDIATLGLEFIRYMQTVYPALLMSRYKLDSVSEDPLQTMEDIALKRGFIMPGKRIDYDRCARTVLDEFRAGKIGRITLEQAEQEQG